MELNTRLNKLHKDNENTNLDIAATSEIRGGIKEVRLLLKDLINEPRKAAPQQPDPYA